MAQPTEDRMKQMRARLRDRADVMVEEMLTRMRSDIPLFFTSDDPDYVAVYTASCHDHITLMVEEMTGSREVPDALPFSSIEETRTVAQWGIPLEALVQTYRSGHAVVWDHTMDAAESCISNAREHSQILKICSRFLFSYFDRSIVLLTEVYENERLSLFQESDRRRRQMVRDLLEGLPVDHAKLQYRLDGLHVAAISTGDDAERTLRRLAARSRLDCLTVRGPSKSVWAWLGGRSLADPATREAVLEAVPRGTFVAFGEVAEGVEGFRVSHREAREAYRLGRQLRLGSLQYGDVALLSLSSRDEVLAREFVQRELVSLAAPDPRARELRQTVRAYFDTGHNASAAAVLLSLSDRTVGNRLRTVEERLGRPLLSRRDELSVALRLFEMYERADAAGPDDAETSPPPSR